MDKVIAYLYIEVFALAIFLAIITALYIISKTFESIISLHIPYHEIYRDSHIKILRGVFNG